jgi:hypothetical protein
MPTIKVSGDVLIDRDALCRCRLEAQLEAVEAVETGERDDALHDRGVSGGPSPRSPPCAAVPAPSNSPSYAASWPRRADLTAPDQRDRFAPVDLLLAPFLEVVAFLAPVLVAAFFGAAFFGTAFFDA